MEEEDADVVIAATCSMLSCSAQVAITAVRKEHKSRRSAWIRSYLRTRNVYSVYTALLPDFRQLIGCPTKLGHVVSCRLPNHTSPTRTTS